MTFVRALVPATLLMLGAALPALAQSPWPAPQPQAAQPAPWPSDRPQAPQGQQTAPWPSPQGQAPQQQAAPWPAPQGQAPQQQAAPWPGSGPPQQSQEDSACLKEFTSLRDATGKRADAIRAASDRKAPPKEACALFNVMVTAEAKFVKFVVDNTAKCGIPPQAQTQLKENHKRTVAIRTQVCNAAAQGPAAPRAPTLSDALGTPTTNSSNVKTGRGTFDTLTGTPLGRSEQ